jgi:hypothetical protein
MTEAVRTSETSVDNHFTRQYISEDNSEHHTSRRENLKSHKRLQVTTTLTSFGGWNYYFKKFAIGDPST